MQGAPLGAPTLRWKVGKLSLHFESRMVWAADADTAKAMFQAGEGSAAEQWDQDVVMDAAEASTTFASMMPHEAKQWMIPAPWNVSYEEE